MANSNNDLERAHDARRNQGREERRDREEARVREQTKLDPPDEKLSKEERYKRNIQES